MMMVIPLVTLHLWRYFELNILIYEVAPGILSGLITFCSQNLHEILAQKI